MDKVDFALCGVEDNIERIKRLERAVSELRSKRAVTVANGVVDGGVTSFGNVSGVLAIIAFDGERCDVFADGNRIGGGDPPIVAELSQGALTLGGVRENSKAFIIR